jgi:hypothetical protein
MTASAARHSGTIGRFAVLIIIIDPIMKDQRPRVP